MAGPWEQFSAKPAAQGVGPWDQFKPAQVDLSPASMIPGGAAPVARVDTPEPTFMDKITGGIEAARAFGTGMTSGLVGRIGGTLGGIAGQIATGEFGTDAGMRRAKWTADDAAARLTYEPQTERGQAYTKGIGEAVSATGIEGLPLGGEMNAMTSLMPGAARQMQAALGTEAHALKSAGRAVADTKILPRIDPNTADLAAKAQALGIKLTPDMLGQNKFARIAGETAAKIPLSGSPTAGNQMKFNQSIIRLIGGDSKATALTPDVYEAALNTAGRKIGDISARTPILMDESFSSALANNLDEALKYQTEDVSRVVGSYVNEIKNKASETGVVDGTAFRTLHSKLGRQIRSTSNGDLKQALGDIQESMADALQRNIKDPAELSVLLDARKKYAMAKTVEPLVGKSSVGDISPAALMARVNADNAGKTRMATGQGGELGDLARIGQRFLKDPGSSNTAERAATYGIFGQAGKAAGAVAAMVPANLYNRLGPTIANRMVKNSQAKSVPPVSFPMGLLEDSPFPAPAAASPGPYTGLLSLADDASPAYSIGGVPKGADPIKATRSQVGGVPDTQRMATSHDIPTMDFPLRQEVLQQPEIASAVSQFVSESERLQNIVRNAINPRVRDKAAADLAAIQQEFGAGMKQLGIDSAADAHGLNRPLYETGRGTRLPIKKTGKN